MRSDIKLYIDGLAVEITDTTVIASNFQAANVSDLTSRLANYTNRINVPPTRTNLLNLGYPNNPNAINEKPYRKLPARVVQNGIETLSNGTAVIVGYDGTNILVDIYSGIYSFFDIVGQKYIGDLDTSSFDTYPSAPTPALVQPYIDYGAAELLAIVDPIQFSGSEYYSIPYSRLIETIIEQAGYTKAGSIFSNPKYLAMHLSALGYGGYNLGFTGPKEFEANAKNVVKVLAASYSKLSFPVTVKGSDFWNGDTYHVVNATYSDVYYSTDVFCTITISVVGNNVDLQLFTPDGVQTFSNVGSGTYEFKINSENESSTIPTQVQCKNGTLVYMQARTGGTSTITVTGKFYNKVRPQPAGSFVSAGGLLPELFQKDLLKDFAVRFGVIFSENANVLTCTTITEIINNRVDAKDWSKKVDRLKPDKFEFDTGRYARNNYLSYDFKEQFLDFLGRGNISIDNENLDVANPLYECPFVNSNTRKFGNPVSGYITASSIPAVELTYQNRVQDLSDCKYYFYYTTALSGLYSIPINFHGSTGDGVITPTYVMLQSGDRVLVVGRGALDGPYECGAGAWVRASDADTPEQLAYARVKITEGFYKDSYWLQTVSRVNVDVTPLIWRQTTINKTEVKRVVEEKNAPGIRLTLVRNKYSYEPTLAGGNSTYKVAYFIDDLAPHSLHFQSFIDEFYPEFYEALQRTKLINRYYDLSELDIYTLDFLKLIYDNGSYYMINKVNNYIPGNTTQVQIFKVS